MTITRRSFVHQAAATATLGWAFLRSDAVSQARAAVQQSGNTPADVLARDDDFWFRVQQAYDVDRSVINLNNGGVSPAPETVLDAYIRHLRFTNNLPARNLWTVLDPQVETVRAQLARIFGCDAEEIAITRNASEGLEALLYGLDLKRGDEVLTTSFDYPRMVNTLKQRELREGIVLKQFSIPTPPAQMEDLATLFEQNITPRTRVMLVSHITFINGQIFPVRRVCQLGRERGIDVIVDGAHSFAHFAFQRDDLDCDFFATSLHKWLSAPIGTGLLYVRKNRIADVWPLMAAPQPQSDNIRKFEEIGTHPTAPRLAIAEAIAFYDAIGPQRKEQRLRFLRDQWALRLAQHDRISLFTSLDPSQGCAIGTMAIDGISGGDLFDHLWKKHRIFTSPIKHEHIDGIRVTPNLYTTLPELDAFCEAIDGVIRNGIG